MFCMGPGLLHVLRVPEELRLVHQFRAREMGADLRHRKERTLGCGELARAESSGTYRSLSQVTCVWLPIPAELFSGRCSLESYSQRQQPPRSLPVATSSIHPKRANLKYGLTKLRPHYRIRHLGQVQCHQDVASNRSVKSLLQRGNCVGYLLATTLLAASQLAQIVLATKLKIYSWVLAGFGFVHANVSKADQDALKLELVFG